jgi:2-iminobutanoate/2-iminopropanoate deaminase
MATRTSIYVEGFSHKNPIPAACRIGNLLFSGSIQGTDPATGMIGATLEAQCAFMFANMRRIVEGGGGTTAHIAKMTVWMRDRSQRAALNHEWLAMFPDAGARPARHTMQADLDGGKLIECDFVAVIG